MYHNTGQIDEALRFHLEALRAARDKKVSDLQTLLTARSEISRIQSDIGNHQKALEYLQDLSPLVQIVARQNPLYFYVYHNELAVELSEIGRLAEAQAAIAVALNSPYAAAYPEWSATREEIAEKQRDASPSFVALNCAPEAAPSPRPQPLPRSKPVAVLAFQWPAPDQTYLQTSALTITLSRVIATGEINWRILCRVRHQIRPRAPPSQA